MVELEFMESDAWPCHVQRQSASVLAEPLENRLRCMYIYIFIIIYIYIRKLAEDLLILAPGLTHLTLRASFLINSAPRPSPLQKRRWKTQSPHLD